jgi:hypothetical protein
MIKDGDRILVCLSGGKDSLSLLHMLHQYQFYARSKGVSFTLGAATVDPGSNAYDPRPLIPYLKQLGVPYFYEEQSKFRLFPNDYEYNKNVSCDRDTSIGCLAIRVSLSVQFLQPHEAWSPLCCSQKGGLQCFSIGTTP